MIVFDDIIKKIKKKDFTISYEDAIDLGSITNNLNYVWKGKELLYVEIMPLNVKIYVK